MPDLESIGEAVTGGALARTAEPAAGEAVHSRTEDGACLNCGCSVHGDYCHCCGQKAHVHRTLGAFGHDLLHGVLHFEGKIWRTLPLLVWRPGELTRRYIAGERARFVSPIALFLFSVFMMFAVVSMTGSVNVGEFGSATLAEEQSEMEQRLQRLETRRRDALAGGAEGRTLLPNIEENIAEARSELELIKSLRGQGLVQAKRGRARAEFQTDLPWLEEAYSRAKQNPELLLYKVQTNAYKFSWALIPISVPLVWLLFIHRRRYRAEYGAYDHTVFATYSLSFMSLLVVVTMLVAWLGWPRLTAALIVLVPPIHIYRQLRGAYRLTHASALWRTIALTFFAIAALSLFVGLLFTMGALE